MFVALREIRSAKGRFGLMSGVVALICTLLVVLSALTGGLGRQSTSALDALPPGHVALAVGPNGTVSWDDSVVTAVQERVYVDAGIGVERVQMARVRLASGGSVASAAALGVQPGGRYAASLAGGGTPSALGADEIALDAPTASRLGVGPHDRVVVNGRRLTVSGIVPTRWVSHQPVVLVSTDTARALTAPQPGQVATALLLDVHGRSATQLERLDHVAGTRSMSSSEALTALPAYRSEHGALTMIQAFLYGISALVVVAFVSVWTIQRTRELAVLRALGASRGYVLRDSLGQAAVVLLLGALTGALLGLGALLAIGDRAPVLVSGWGVAQPALGVTLLGLAGSLLATRRVVRVDPMLALGGN